MTCELLLHIGYPKAASTSLQRSVFPNLESHGFEYLGQFPDERGVALGDNAAKRLVNNIARHVSSQAGSETIPLCEILGDSPAQQPRILSHEGFVFLSIRREVVGGRLLSLDPFAIAQALQSVVSEFESKVLIVVRRQDELLLSLYAQSYTQFFRRIDGLDTFSRFLDNLRPGAVYEHIFRALYYDEIVLEYQRLFGRDRVAVLPYELLVHDETEFLSRLALVVGIDEFRCPVSKDNVRRRGDGSKVSKSMNLYELGFRWLKANTPKDGLIWNTLRPMRWAFAPLKKVRAIAPIGFDLSADQRESILEQFAESNRALSGDLDLELGRYGYFR